MSIGIVILLCSISFCVGSLAGDKIGWWLGVIEGYGATKYPDAPTFSKARRCINRMRERDGLPPIEEAVQ